MENPPTCTRRVWLYIYIYIRTDVPRRRRPCGGSCAPRSPPAPRSRRPLAFSRGLTCHDDDKSFGRSRTLIYRPGSNGNRAATRPLAAVRRSHGRRDNVTRAVADAATDRGTVTQSPPGIVAESDFRGTRTRPYIKVSRTVVVGVL